MINDTMVLVTLITLTFYFYVTFIIELIQNMYWLANGQSSVASKQGMVKLSSMITLYDVLFVSGLTCNLISIAQLINDLVSTVMLLINYV